MQILNLIKQINHARHDCDKLHEQIELGIRSKKTLIDAEGLYKQNEKHYYILLRCEHEIDGFLEEQCALLTFEERSYFEALLMCVKSLLKAIQYFPKLTYFFWQKSLGKHQNKFYQDTFTGDWNKYQMLNVQTGKMFGRMKQFN